MTRPDAAPCPYRQQLKCSFPEIDKVFDDCLLEARTLLSPEGLEEYLDAASLVCMIGRGWEPVLVYLEEMPQVAARMGEGTLSLVSDAVWRLSRTPNGRAIPPFMACLGEAARRLGSEEQLRRWITLVFHMMERTTGSIHGRESTLPSPGLPDMLDRMPFLLGQVSLEGLRNWIDYGVRIYRDHPERQRDFFALQSADSKAVLQRERHGTLFADVERRLDLGYTALWAARTHFVPYSMGFHDIRAPVPYYDELGIRVPDVYDDRAGVSGLDRYRALTAHVAAHQRWSSPLFADNYAPFQRLAIEFFEDSRVEWLAMREYPGLRALWRALHPAPAEKACDPTRESCIRHRLARFSRAVLDPDHGDADPDLNEFVGRFHALMASGRGTTKAVAELAVTFIARTRRQTDAAANVHFTDTEIDYRDDNRNLWRYIEMGDEEESFDRQQKPEQRNDEQDQGLPPRHYPEWDYHTKTYRPDWVSLYESLHPSGDGGLVDALLAKHAALAKRLKQLLDLLKPQYTTRVRYQEEGSELDLDVALRSLIDFKSGTTPDPRINMSHTTSGRDIAVMLLLDLSESLSRTPSGCTQTLLELSREAVSLLGWAVDRLGDEFAIAGFSSNTRHEVRYQHLKGYTERWDNAVKARVAAMGPGYSTRMGAALRHAGHYLAARKADKKLLLVLTDGEPSDVDVKDPRHLIEDTHKAVYELDRQGIYTYCINLDQNADDYVRDVFGNRFTVIDRVEHLPEKLPRLFMALTK